MSENFYEDYPLFSAEDDSGEMTDDGKPNNNYTSSLEVIETTADIKRKEKILSFSFKLIIIFLSICGILILLDALFDKLEINNSLIKEFFDLLKYSTTSVLGYLFASEHKK